MVTGRDSNWVITCKRTWIYYVGIFGISVDFVAEDTGLSLFRRPAVSIEDDIGDTRFMDRDRDLIESYIRKLFMFVVRVLPRSSLALFQESSVSSSALLP
jgi:hypothetical protein